MCGTRGQDASTSWGVSASGATSADASPPASWGAVAFIPDDDVDRPRLNEVGAKRRVACLEQILADLERLTIQDDFGHRHPPPQQLEQPNICSHTGQSNHPNWTMEADATYDRLHYRIVPAAGNTIDVRITFRATNAEGRSFKKTEVCNLPKEAAFSEEDARAYLEEQQREKAKAASEMGKVDEGPTLEEQRQKYHDYMKDRTERMLQAEDDEGKAILRELQELMTIQKEGYKDSPTKPSE